MAEDIVIRLSTRCSMNETIERVFADAKENTPCDIRSTEVSPGYKLLGSNLLP